MTGVAARTSLLDRVEQASVAHQSAVGEPGGATVSGAELARRARAVASSLRARGLRSGDAVFFSVRVQLPTTRPSSTTVWLKRILPRESSFSGGIGPIAALRSV